MSVFTYKKNTKQSKVPNSQYIKTENKPDEGTAKPSEPANPKQPEAN